MNFHVGQKVYFKNDVMELWGKRRFGILRKYMLEQIKLFEDGATIKKINPEEGFNTLVIESGGFYFPDDWFETRNSVETEE